MMHGRKNIKIAVGFQNWHSLLPEYGTLIPKHLIGETKGVLIFNMVIHENEKVQ
jgi:hypothetical protein